MTTFRQGLALGLMYGIPLGMALMGVLNLGSRLVGETRRGRPTNPGRKHT